MSVKSSSTALCNSNAGTVSGGDTLLPENEPPEHNRCRQAIRSFCLCCQGRLAAAVEACADTDCPLHLYRLGLQDKSQASSTACSSHPSAINSPPLRPLRAERCYCLVCTGNQRAEIRSCAAKTSCSLWPFRFGVSRSVYLRGKARWRGPKQFGLPGLKIS